MKKFFILAIFVAAPFCLAAADDVQPVKYPDDMKQVAEAYIQHIKKGEWKGAADQMHPEALKSFTRIFQEIAEVDDSGSIYRMFKVKTKEEFLKLKDHQVFSRLMEFLVTYTPQFKKLLMASDFLMIGYVMDMEDNKAFIVYRFMIKNDEMDYEKYEVLPLKRYNKGWKILLTGDIKNIATAMKKRLAPVKNNR